MASFKNLDAETWSDAENLLLSTTRYGEMTLYCGKESVFLFSSKACGIAVGGRPVEGSGRSEEGDLHRGRGNEWREPKIELLAGLLVSRCGERATVGRRERGRAQQRRV